jgi:hypothetical protein
MKRQTVITFTCRTNRLSSSIMERAGGFEIVSVSHALVGPSSSNVVLVIKGDVDGLQAHEQSLLRRGLA